LRPAVHQDKQLAAQFFGAGNRLAGPNCLGDDGILKIFIAVGHVSDQQGKGRLALLCFRHIWLLSTLIYS